MLTTFWDLLRESVIIQGLLTVGLWSAILYMAVTGQPIPDILTGGGYAILGFWFGTKVQTAIHAGATAVAKASADVTPCP